jgi:hypothetical protein
LFGVVDAPRRALILHHPGRSGLHTRLQRAFAGALAERGWRVALRIARPDQAMATRGCDLLVLGAPAYNYRAARPLREQLRRLGPLDGVRTALVLTGGGMTDAALRHLFGLATRAGARVVATLEIWGSRDNAERHGLNDPVEIMRRAACAIAEADMISPAKEPRQQPAASPT